MSNNRNPYMTQNMSANPRNVNMRGGCGCAGNAGQTPQNNYAQRSMQNDCGCAGNMGTVAPANYAQRASQNDCGCAGNSGYARVAEMPTGDRTALLAYIDQVSFAAYEAALYLDTHPDCQSGLQYFREHNEKRNLALKEYAKLYGPLTLKQADESCETYWQWVNQPWPWEGGNC